MVFTYSGRACPCPLESACLRARVASHLGVMAIVAAVMGVVVAGLAIPFAGVLGIGAKSLSHSVEDLPANLRTQPLAQQTQIVDPRGQHGRDPLRPEPHQRPAEPDLAQHGQVDRRHRGLPLLPARRARPEGHAPGPGHQPGQWRLGPGWLVDHPADGQDDPARPGEDRQGSARRRPPTPTPARSPSCATRSPSSRTTPRTGSSSATSTSPTTATARTAYRLRRATTSTPTPRTSPCSRARPWPAWSRTPRATTRSPTPTAACSAATSCSTGWPSST